MKAFFTTIITILLFTASSRAGTGTGGNINPATRSNKAGAHASDSLLVVRLSTIGALYTFSGPARTAIVDNQGEFYKLPKGGLAADSIVTYPSNQVDSLWFRQYDKHTGINVDWLPSMPKDSTISSSRALNYIFNLYKTNTTINATPGRVYMVDSAIVVTGAYNLTIDFKWARVKETFNNVGTVKLSGTNIIFRNATLIGAEDYTAFQANSPTTFRGFVYITNSNNITVENIIGSMKRSIVYLGKVNVSKVQHIWTSGFLDPTHKLNANFCPSVVSYNDNLVNPVTAEHGYAVFEDIYAQNTGSALLCGDETKHFSINNIRGTYLFDQGIYVSSAMYGSITNCHFKSMFGSFGIKGRGRGIIIANNSVVNCTSGISMTGNGNAAATDPFDGGPYPDEAGGNGYGNVVANNIVDSVSARGFNIAEQDGLAQHDVSVTNNTVGHHTATGDYAFYVTARSGIYFSGNKVFKSSATIAVLFSNGTSDSLRTSTFTDNHFKLLSGIGIRFQTMRNSLISGNVADSVAGNFIDMKFCNNNTVVNNKNHRGIVVQAISAYTNTGNYIAFNTGGSINIDAANNVSLFNYLTTTPASLPLGVLYGGLNTSTAPASAQIPIAQSATAYAPKTISGDITVSNTGAATVGAGKITLAKTSFLTGSATLDFPSTASGAVADLTITVTGAALGDTIALGIPNGSVTGTASYIAWVSAANTVTVRFSPKATEDPASGTFKVTVVK